MAALFGWRKSPADIVKLATRSMAGTDDKARDEVVKRVAEMKGYVCGEAQSGKAPKEEKCNAIAQAMIDNDIINAMATYFGELDFEVRKELASVVSKCTTHDYAGFRSTYLANKTEQLAALLQHYSNPDAALLAGSIVRDAVRSASALHVGILVAEPHHDEYTPLNKYIIDLLHTHVDNDSFEVAADALATIKVLSTANPTAVRAFLESHHSAFFGAYDVMLRSTKYATRLEGLKLLSELLLDKDNFGIMVQFVRSKGYMRGVMTLMRDKHTSIQFEAFHVFKLFVANPEKPAAIQEVLASNQAKLVAFIRNLCNDRDDADFMREKALIIETLMRCTGGDAAAEAGAGATAPTEASAVETVHAAAAGTSAAAATTTDGAADSPSASGGESAPANAAAAEGGPGSS